MKRRKSFLTSLALLLSLSPLARAGAPADTAPAGSLLFLSFKGSRHLGPAYESSHLKPILDASGLRQFYHEVLPQLLQKSLANDPASAQTLAHALTSLEVLSRHGFSLHLLTLDQDGTPSAGLSCDAEDEADALEKTLRSLASAAPSPHLLAVRRTGTRLSLLVGNDPASPAQSLSASPAFQAALKEVETADPVLLAYIDFERVFALADQRCADTPWPKIKSAAGLAGLKRFAISGSFDGPDWSTRSFTEAPAPRTGWLALLHADALPQTLLARIPADATSALATHVDLAGWVQSFRDVAGAAGGPDAQRKFDQALGFASLYVGRNLLTDVLGPDWVLYSSPSVVHPDNRQLLAVAVNQLADEAKARDGLTSLTYALANSSHIPQAKALGLSATVADVEIAGLKITHLTFDKPLPNLPQNFSPAWAIKDGLLYFGPSPAAVAAAASYAGPALPDAAPFTSLRSRLAAPATAAFEFTDLPSTASTTYPALRSLADAGRAALGADGIKTSANPLPTLAELSPELTPVLSASWTDPAGFHTRSTSPFPGASLLTGGGLTTVGSAALATSILLPSLNRARETANRVKCASNMKQVGTAIFLYAGSHKYHYPPDLGTLVITQDIADSAFVCPDSDSHPVDPTGLTHDQLRARVSADSDYTYLGQNLTVDDDPNALVLYENIKNHEDGTNMLFSDGSVYFILRKDAARIIAAKRRSPQDR
jgi:hypothetical protein